MDCRRCREPMIFLRSRAIYDHFACGQCVRLDRQFTEQAAEHTQTILKLSKHRRRRRRRHPYEPLPTLARQRWY